MPEHAANAIAHVDIAGPDHQALSRFYGEVFGWEITPRGPGYAQVGTPDGGPDGALVEAEQAGLAVGVAVDDVAASLAVAVQAGGRELMPPTDNGWVVKAQVSDPAGNAVTLIQR
ncbi:MAG: VOC family protein [Dermatophilaceae bacterium]